jgi:hypothetical protein
VICIGIVSTSSANAVAEFPSAAILILRLLLLVEVARVQFLAEKERAIFAQVTTRTVPSTNGREPVPSL